MINGEGTAIRPPNPYDAQQPLLEMEGVRPGKRDMRRAAILAATRRLITDLRFTGFTVRALADATRISTQALHNRFGSKDAMIAAAINDYSTALMHYGTSVRLAHNPVLSFVTSFSLACDIYPEFLRRILPNTFFERSGARVFHLTHNYGTKLIHRALLDMHRQSRIVSDANLRLIAMAVSTLMGATLLDWARGAITSTELKKHMAYKINLLMNGIEYK